MREEDFPYGDILFLEHPTSRRHPRMSMLNRAAQFSPYAALVGFDGVIAETGRLTDRRQELSAEEEQALDQRTMMLAQALQRGERPEVTVLYFVPDERKDGGMYVEYTGRVRRLDLTERTIQFAREPGAETGRVIRFEEIMELRGEGLEQPETWEL